MATTDRIEVNPAIMQGKPVIRGTRVPVELILRKLGEGAKEKDLLDAYPHLTQDDIRRRSSTPPIRSRPKKSSERCVTGEGEGATLSRGRELRLRGGAGAARGRTIVRCV